MKKRQTYRSFTVQDSLELHERELGAFDSASTAFAVSSAIDNDAFVLSDDDVRQVAEGKVTFPCLQAQIRIELALRCAQQIRDSALVEAWSRCLDVISAAPKKRDIEKVRRRD